MGEKTLFVTKHDSQRYHSHLVVVFYQHFKNIVYDVCKSVTESLLLIPQHSFAATK